MTALAPSLSALILGHQNWGGGGARLSPRVQVEACTNAQLALTKAQLGSLTCERRVLRL